MLVTDSESHTNGLSFKMGDLVRKKSGSLWRGMVCGFYCTEHDTIGYCVESIFERGTVLNYPEASLEKWDGI